MDSGCDSVGRVVVSDTTETQFKSHHWQILFAINCFTNCIETAKIKTKEAGNVPFFKIEAYACQCRVLNKTFQTVFDDSNETKISIQTFHYSEFSALLSLCEPLSLLHCHPNLAIVANNKSSIKELTFHLGIVLKQT